MTINKNEQVTQTPTLGQAGNSRRSGKGELSHIPTYLLCRTLLSGNPPGGRWARPGHPTWDCRPKSAIGNKWTRRACNRHRPADEDQPATWLVRPRGPLPTTHHRGWAHRISRLTAHRGHVSWVARQAPPTGMERLVTLHPTIPRYARPRPRKWTYRVWTASLESRWT